MLKQIIAPSVLNANFLELGNGLKAIENGAEKVVKDEEVVKVLEILEAATEVARSWKK